MPHPRVGRVGLGVVFPRLGFTMPVGLKRIYGQRHLHFGSREIGTDGTDSILHSLQYKAAPKRSVLLDYALFDGEAEEFGIVGEAEVLHDAVFVKGDSAGGDVQDGGGFFHGVAFGEELQDFALARSQDAANFGGARFPCG